MSLDSITDQSTGSAAGTPDTNINQQFGGTAEPVNDTLASLGFVDADESKPALYHHRSVLYGDIDFYYTPTPPAGEDKWSTEWIYKDTIIAETTFDEAVATARSKRLKNGAQLTMVFGTSTMTSLSGATHPDWQNITYRAGVFGALPAKTGFISTGTPASVATNTADMAVWDAVVDAILPTTLTVPANALQINIGGIKIQGVKIVTVGNNAINPSRNGVIQLIGCCVKSNGLQHVKSNGVSTLEARTSILICTAGIGAILGDSSYTSFRYIVGGYPRVEESATLSVEEGFAHSQVTSLNAGFSSSGSIHMPYGQSFLNCLGVYIQNGLLLKAAGVVFDGCGQVRLGAGVHSIPNGGTLDSLGVPSIRFLSGSKNVGSLALCTSTIAATIVQATNNSDVKVNAAQTLTNPALSTNALAPNQAADGSIIHSY